MKMVPTRRIILSNKTIVSEESPVFVIAEIGQNHQGNIEMAKDLIIKAKECQANCVKFQKSCLWEKFTKEALDASYISPHSWGDTYGKHKSHLEFSEEQYMELQKFAEDHDILFTASAMDSVSLEFLNSLDVPFIKLGSGDSTNILLLEEAARLRRSLVISTGMCTMEDVEIIYNIISKEHNNFALLHCVSSYPTDPKDANLGVIPLYISKFPVLIGYSGHELGFNLTLAAVTLGAKIVERHITLDKSLKGNDHSCSLDIEEFKMMVKSIREIEKGLGSEKHLLPSEEPCWKKLGKSLVAACDLEEGYTLTKKNIAIKVSKPKGIPSKFFYQVLGKRVLCRIPADSPILESCILN